jgi:dipeptidyl aminopeptidase/acylaminoacyl peptidase
MKKISPAFPTFVDTIIFMTKKTPLPLLALLILFQIGAAQTTKRTLRPSDVYRMQSTGNARVSPDGTWVVYTLSSVDSVKDKRNTDIWMMSWQGTEKVQLTNSPDAESNPKWSPDGKYISFMSSRSGGGNQLYLLNRLGGEAQKLTDVKGDLSDYAWSPDGKKLLLSIEDFEDTTGKKKNLPYVIDRYHFKQDVSGYLYDKRKTHLYLFDVAVKKTDTLTKGNYNEGNMQWSPDGTAIAFVSNRTEDPDKNSNSDIFVIDAKPGSTARQLTSWKGSDSSPQWSPDGKTIAYLRSTSDANFIMYDQPVLCTMPATGGEPVLLSKTLDRPAENPRWSKDGNSIAILITDDCERYIGAYDLKSGKLNKVIGGKRSFYSLDLHPNGNWMVAMASAELPSEYYALENGNLRRLTTIQDDFVSPVSLASVEKFTSRSKDGATVSNLLYLPPHAGKEKLPVIFFIHGGPVAQDEFGFDLSRQMLAANGYAVVAVNYRGSEGRGIEYCKSIYADWGNKEVLDISGAADYLISRGIVDANKMGIGGWSYGGILTDYTIAKDTRFKAAASGAGSALQLSLYGVDQYVLQYDNEIGQPWKDRNYEKYLKLSAPFLNADKIKTPTLFMVGEKDFNVPAAGSEQMYQALRSIGIPTQLIVYPGQFHGINIPSFQKDRFDRYIQWFDKYLKPKGF